MPRYFTLPEAEALLPEVAGRLQSAVAAKEEVERRQRELQAVISKVAMVGGAEIDPAAVAATKSRRHHAIELIQKTLAEIQGEGVLVKDLETGLLDFPTLLEGREVYLCWKLGEERIGWWHPVDTGFAGRRRITDDLRFEKGDQSPRPN